MKILKKSILVGSVVSTIVLSNAGFAAYPVPPAFSDPGACAMWINQYYINDPNLDDTYWMWFAHYESYTSSSSYSCSGNNCVAYYPAANSSNQNPNGGCAFVGNSKFWPQVGGTLTTEVNNLNSNLASLPDHKYGIQCSYQKGSAVPGPDADSCKLVTY